MLIDSIHFTRLEIEAQFLCSIGYRVTYTLRVKDSVAKKTIPNYSISSEKFRQLQQNLSVDEKFRPILRTYEILRCQ